MNMNITSRLFALCILLLGFSYTKAQEINFNQIAKEYLQKHSNDLKITHMDVSDIIVSDKHQSRKSNLTHIYLSQRFNGIKIHNAGANMSILENGEIVALGNRLIANIDQKINTTVPLIPAEQAIAFAAQYLKIPFSEFPRLKENKNTHYFLYEKSDISEENIPVELFFQPMPDKTLRLAWKIDIDVPKHADYWSLRVDALTGEILDENNYTSYCQFSHSPTHTHLPNCIQTPNRQPTTDNRQMRTENWKITGDGSKYNVFAIPIESPSHGSRSVVQEPADPMASPWGWHDFDGQDGADFTITRGNNVHAYLDEENSNNSQGDEPDGGNTLEFNFPFNPNNEPSGYQDFAITQLFYLSNVMHDFAYAYGFDEDAGNFQMNNYGNGGGSNDWVRSEGQDGSGLNNANFTAPPDGSRGRMQMFRWNAGQRLLTIEAPANVAGFYPTGLAEFGPQVTDDPITAEIVEVNDGVTFPLISDGCNPPFINESELVGKIALVDRGGCFFQEKANYAEEAGAIALIICNFEDGVNTLGANGMFPNPGIPTLSLGSGDCAVLREFAGSGLVGSFVIPDQTGPVYLDGDLDNGIIAHEYAHGISNRLTNGASNTSCLDTNTKGDEEIGEQMGEGWSDFYALALTTKFTDTGDMPRGVGTYIHREPNSGKGVRSYPYATDMSIMPLTYADISGARAPHGVGTIWCAMLWDLYWSFVEEYGWDPDLYHGTGGNNMIMHLVTEGMKIQPCQPGFVDGKNAIIAADVALYGGVHECMINEVFARRGLGYNAEQGSTMDHRDGKASFEVKPTCIKTLKIAKEVTPLVEAGENITITITISNHKDEAVTNLMVSDDLLSGTMYVAGSGTIDPVLSGNTVNFEIENLSSLADTIITYQVSTALDNFSIEHFFDGVSGPNADENWEFTAIGEPDDLPANIWEITDTNPYEGDYSWFVEDINGESQQLLQLFEKRTITGTQPVLRFYHLLDTEVGADGGLVEISTDGILWQDLGENIFRNGYTGKISYFTFVTPNLSAFSGDSNGYIPTFVDLSDYTNQEVFIRFRFGTDELVGGNGWYMDNFEIMDMFNYNGEVCVTTSEGDNACAFAPERGTIIESKKITAVTEPLQDISLSIYPNPTRDLLMVSIATKQTEKLSLSLTTLDGKTVLTKELTISGESTTDLNVSHLPSGIYLVKVFSEDGILVKMVVVQ